MINISSDIVTQITSSVSTAIQQLWPVIAVLLSIVIGFYVLRKVIFLMTLTK